MFLTITVNENTVADGRVWYRSPTTCSRDASQRILEPTSTTRDHEGLQAESRIEGEEIASLLLGVGVVIG